MPGRVTPPVQITESELLAALAEAGRATVPPRPPGFYTITELAQSSGRHPTALRNEMRVLLAQGRVERCTVRVALTDGRSMPVTAYKLGARLP